MSLDAEKFKDKLRDIFSSVSDTGFDDFNNIIISSRALIAGGSVLAAYTDSKINDLDIYVHTSMALALQQGLSRMGYVFNTWGGNFISPAYDQSFFRKNNILARYRFRLAKKPPIDLMLIPDDVPLLNVVKNFDLSFCEIWYDGETVTAVDPTSVLTKNGVLKKDYVENLLINFNMFTIKRIKKYSEKGFIINYECAKPLYTLKKQDKQVTSPEEWVVYKIYNSIIFHHYRYEEFIPFINSMKRTTYIGASFKILCTCNIGKYTLSNLEGVLRCLGVLPENYVSLYKKILCREGYRFFEPKYIIYKEYIENILNISKGEMDEYYRNNIPIRDEEYNEGAINAFNFEECNDIDENLITATTGMDEGLYNRDISEHLIDENNFIVGYKGKDEFFFYCLNKNWLRQKILLKKTNWFYECTGPIIPGTNDRLRSSINPTPYIKFIMPDRSFWYIPLIQLQKILSSNNKIYYVYPYLEFGTQIQKIINHSITWYNSLKAACEKLKVEHERENHCQELSKIAVHTLKICRDPDRCVMSLRRYGEEEKQEEELTEEAINAFEFEEAVDIDEALIPNTTCTDFYTGEDDKNIIDHLTETDTFLFISTGPSNEFDVLCFEKNYIENILSNKNDNWFYECIGPIIGETNDRSMSILNPESYIKIPLNSDGLNGFVPLIQLKKLLLSSNKIFYIYPYLENGVQKIITHSTTWKNAYGPEPDWISANHCQSGSSILVYTLKLCRDPVRCIKSTLLLNR